MKIVVVSNGSGFKNTLNFLNRIMETTPTESMHEIGKEGVQSLSSKTPKDTGETAAGWNYKITGGPRTSEVEWYNSAHPESNVNIAKLIELGHGTSNGGYVQPQPYMQKAMDDVFKKAGDKIAKGMTK